MGMDFVFVCIACSAQDNEKAITVQNEERIPTIAKFDTIAKTIHVLVVSVKRTVQMAN